MGFLNLNRSFISECVHGRPPGVAVRSRALFCPFLPLFLSVAALRQLTAVEVGGPFWPHATGTTRLLICPGVPAMRTPRREVVGEARWADCWRRTDATATRKPGEGGPTVLPQRLFKPPLLG